MTWSAAELHCRGSMYGECWRGREVGWSASSRRAISLRPAAADPVERTTWPVLLHAIVSIIGDAQVSTGRALAGGVEIEDEGRKVCREDRRARLRSGRNSANPSRPPPSLHTNLLHTIIIIIITTRRDTIAAIDRGAGVTPVHVHRVAAWRSEPSEVVSERHIIHHTPTAPRPRPTNAAAAHRARRRPTPADPTNAGGVSARRLATLEKIRTQTVAPGRPGLRWRRTAWHPAGRPTTTTPPAATAGRPR